MLSDPKMSTFSKPKDQCPPFPSSDAAEASARSGTNASSSSHRPPAVPRIRLPRDSSPDSRVERIKHFLHRQGIHGLVRSAVFAAAAARNGFPKVPDQSSPHCGSHP